jgi:asparagine synthase (glutamine-hydrolysing)
LRFPQVPTADETPWQEQVVRHLQLSDWVRIELDDEVDIVGPLAASVLAQHGLLWPFNAHFHVPMLEHANGGSLLTGVGGDEILAPNRWARVSYIVRDRLRPRRRDLASFALLALPRPIRVEYFARFESTARAFPWLTDLGRSEAERYFARLHAHEPVTWSRWTEDVYWPSRHRLVGASTLGRLASHYNVLAAHPFADPNVLGSMLGEFAPLGFRSRSAAMTLLFGDVLPDAILHRESKASFDAAFWHRHARTFATSWTGDGVPTDLVDTAALRRIWSLPTPDPRTFTLLQAAFTSRGAEFP